MCFSSFAQLPQRLKSTVFEKFSHSGAALIEKISQNIDFRIFLHKLPTHFPSFSLLVGRKSTVYLVDFSRLFGFMFSLHYCTMYDFHDSTDTLKF